MRRFQKKSRDQKRKTKKSVRRFLDTLALCCGKCCQPKTTDDTEDEEGVVDKVSPIKALPDLLPTQEEDSRAVLQEELEEEDQSTAALDNFSWLYLESRDGTDKVTSHANTGEQKMKNEKVEKSSQKCLKCGDPRPLKVAVFVEFFGSVSTCAPPAHPERVTIMDDESVRSLGSTDSTCVNSIIDSPAPCQKLKVETSLDVANEVRKTGKIHISKYSSTFGLLPKNVALFVDFYGKADDKWLDENTEVAETERQFNDDCFVSKSDLMPKNVALFVDFFGVASDKEHSTTQLEKSVAEENAMDKFTEAEAIRVSSRKVNPQKSSSMVKTTRISPGSNSRLLPKSLAQFVDFCDAFTDIAENSEEEVEHKKKLELCTSLSHLLPRSVVEFVGMARDNLNAAEQEVSFENAGIVEFSTEHSIQKDLSGAEDFHSIDDDETEVGSGLEDNEIDVHIQDHNKDASVEETAERVAFDKSGQKTEGVKTEGEARTEAGSVAQQNCKGKKNRKKKQRKKRSKNKKRKGKRGGK